MVHRAQIAYRFLGVMLCAAGLVAFALLALLDHGDVRWPVALAFVLGWAVLPVIVPVDDAPPLPAPGERLGSVRETARAVAVQCAVLVLIGAVAAAVVVAVGDGGGWIPPMLLGLGLGNVALSVRVARHERRHPEVVRALRLGRRRGPVDWRSAWGEQAPEPRR